MPLRQLRAAMLSTCCALPLLLAVTTASAEPTVKLAAGYTTVALSDEFLGALSALKVDASSIFPAYLSGRNAKFPIPAGALDLENARGEITHTGGLRLAAGDTQADLCNFIIDTSGDSPVLTGSVIVNGDYVARLPLFDIKLPAIDLPLQPKYRTLNLSGAELTLTGAAADALNSVFGIKDFTSDIPIGSARIVAIASAEKTRWHGWFR